MARKIVESIRAKSLFEQMHLAIAGTVDFRVHMTSRRPTEVGAAKLFKPGRPHDKHRRPCFHGVYVDD